MATKVATDHVKKLFFCGTAGFDNPGAWCKMMSEAEALGDMMSVPLKLAGWEGKPVNKLRVERCPGENEDTKVYIWGEEEPGFQADNYGQHVGTKVEVDGKVVYNDMRPSEDSEAEDHEDCEDCAKGEG